MWKSRVESVSAAHLKIGVPTKRGKKIDYSSFKATRSSSVNFCRSHKLIAARVGAKLAEISAQIYRGGGDADARSPSPLFREKYLTSTSSFSYLCSKPKWKHRQLYVLQKKFVSELRAAAPGGGSALREPPLRSFGRKSGKKKGKSDTLVELGVSVCQSVKCVRGEKPAARTHTHTHAASSPPPENSPVDNEILTETPSVRLSTRTLDEFHRNSSEIRAIGPAL